MTIATILSWVAVAYLTVGLSAGAIRAVAIPDQRQAAFKMMARSLVAFVVLFAASFFAASQGI